MSAIEKIEAQQAKLKETDPAWMVGEQLKDICRADPHCEKIVEEDLVNSSMSLQKAAGKIKEYVDKNRDGKKCFCVTPKVVDGILREFYGLPTVMESPVPPINAPKTVSKSRLTLTSFLK